MNNTVCVLFYLPLLATNLLLLASMLKKKNKMYVDRLYTLLCLLLLGWQVLEILFFLLPGAGAIEFVFSAKFVFAAFIPVVFFLLVAGFYHLNRAIPLWGKVLGMLVPCTTAVLALTAPWHNLFRRNFVLQSAAPLTTISSQWGVWYIVNLAYSQLLVAGIALIFITQYRKLPKAYRTSVNLLLAGWLVYLAGILAELFKLGGDNNVDFNLIGICLSSLIFYIAVSSNGRADYLNIWRRDVFDHLDEAVLILDDSGTIVEANLPAVRLFEGMLPQLEGLQIEALWPQLAQTGTTSLRAADAGGQDADLAGIDLYLTSGRYPLVYNVRRHPLPVYGRAAGGEFVSLTEVTWNRLLIERLRETAGMDTLTGLQNRFGYETALREVDVPENLPLSVVMGDVNNLKAVNDTLGHTAGDRMLQQVAKLMLRHCPKGSYVARIGGDEFAALLPRCTEAEAQLLARRLSQVAGKAKGDAPPASAAFGYATKTTAAQNLNQLIRQADERMYAAKSGREVRL